MDTSILNNIPYQFEEEERFVSSLSELNTTLENLSNASETNTATDEAQTQAIEENAELDAQQAEDIQALKDAIENIEIPSMAGYATEEWVEGKGYLTEHQDLSEYAKTADVPSVEGLASEEWVEGKGYLTEHQDLSEYAKTADVPSVEGLASEEWVEGKGYLTEHQDLSEYAKTADVPSVEGLASEEWVEGKGYLTEHQDLSEYAKTTDVPSVEGLASEEWVEGKGYLTEHQDLSEYAKTADVPSVEGLASEEWVEGKGYLTEHQDLSEYAKTEDTNKMMSQLLTRIEMLEKVQTNLVVADSAEEIASITEPLNTNVVVKSQEVIETLTSDTTYKSIAIVGGDTEKSIKIAATDSITVDGLTINGEKDGGNGKINFTANTIEIKNIDITHGSTSYNVFEGSQQPNDESTLLHSLNAKNLNVDDVNLTHNVINIYTPADNAQIKIADSYFNLNVSKSNVLRISNYANATNVVVTLENIEWTYENVDSPESDFGYAGVVLYQPAGNDVLLSGDTSAISTWTFNFKNCKYNGEKITSLNFGQHSQIMYMYNVGGSKKSSNPLDIEGLTINFE